MTYVILSSQYLWLNNHKLMRKRKTRGFLLMFLAAAKGLTANKDDYKMGSDFLRDSLAGANPNCSTPALGQVHGTGGF